MLENIARTGIIEQLFLHSKTDMSETLSLLHYEQICLWYMESRLYENLTWYELSHCTRRSG